MLRTPEKISKARQKLRSEIEIWKTVIAKAHGDAAKVTFGQAEVARCRREMRRLLGKKQFWPKVS